MTINYQLQPGAEFVQQDSKSPCLKVADGVQNLEGAGPGTCKALGIMCDGGAPLSDLEDLVLTLDEMKGLAGFLFILEKLRKKGLIVQTLLEGESPVASLAPCSEYYEEPEEPAPHRFKLSRFAYSAMIDNQMALETPMAHARLFIHEPQVLSLFYAFSKPLNPWEEELLSDFFTSETVLRLVSLFYKAGIIVKADSNGHAQEDLEPPVCNWEFHDLLHMTYSRMGKRKRSFGASYRFRNKVPAPPVKVTNQAARTVDLFKPEVDLLEKTDPPFALVHESRKSIRRFSENPITAKQLGEFLYRTARTRWVDDSGEQEIQNRPYPSSGGIYELELYPIVVGCEGLEAGLYHYHSQTHQLAQLTTITDPVKGLLKEAVSATGAVNLQILIIITCRFPRVSWKYESIAYSLTLKNMGALCQSMYLNATAMDLGACLIGSGNVQRFAEATGKDPLEECSLGEFILGRRS